MRILITGWRAWPASHAGLIWSALDAAVGRAGTPPGVVVVHGKCPYGGADEHAAVWVQMRGHAEEPHPAETGAGGKLLGPARNTEMVRLGADLCLGFPGPGSRGTWDCLRKAVDAGIPTRVYGWHELLKAL